MFDTFKKHALCGIPSLFFPTIILLVDDDKTLLEQLTTRLGSDYKVQSYTNPDEALDAINFLVTNFQGGDFLPKSSKNSLLAVRREIFNQDRFKRHVISVLDYDMPERNGVDIMNIAGRVDIYSRSSHSYILLTGKSYEDIEEEDSNIQNTNHIFISKNDKDAIEKLIKQINIYHQELFQSSCYPLSIELSSDPKEKTSFPYAADFLPIFNRYIKEHDIR